MNKIKLMYDVAKTMREKEVFTGSLAINGKRDQIDCFSFTNEFEKNTSTGQVKLKIKINMNCDGKQMKHESSSEFNIQNLRARMRHHHHHMGHNFDFQSCCSDDPERCDSGFKTRMSGLMFILRVIDDMKVEELENNELALSIKLDELPEGLANRMHSRFQHRMSPGNLQGHPRHPVMKALCCLEKPQIMVNIKLNQDKAIEAINITADGKRKDESDNLHDVNIKADLMLKW